MKNQLFLILIVTLTSCGFANGNPCKGLWLGQIVADPDSCTAFYICVPLVPIRVMCDSDKIFSPKDKECRPGDQDTCELYGAETTTVVITTPSGPSLSEICRGVFFAARPYPLSMTSYVGCIRGEGTLKQCFSDEYFNPSVNECVSASTTMSTTESTTSEFTTESTTTTTIFPVTKPPPIEGKCDGIERGYVAYPDDCSLYILCIDGSEANILQCRPGEIFDLSVQRCRAGNQETCIFLENNTQPITEPSTTVEVATSDAPSSTPESTATESITTQEPTTVVTKTESVTTSTRTTELVTTSESTTVPETETNICDGVINGTLPHEDCTKYIRCSNEIGVTLSCRDGYIFSSERNRCIVGNPESC